MLYRVLMMLVLWVGSFQAATATIIYDIVNISGATWEYSYTIENDSLLTDIEEFTIFFDLGLYENLSISSTPADWDPLIIQPDPLLPDDGFFDSLALVSGIAAGDSLGGFSVQFDFLGTGTPGVQYFSVVDPFNFNVLEDGNTQLAAVTSVPEPASMWLFGLGLIGLLTAKNYTLGTSNKT